MVGVMSIQETTTIYVALLDEGTDVWRPVQAAQRTDGSYIILSTNGDPEDEKWQFPSGGIVQCEMKTLSGRSEEHTSELQSLMRISYAVFCLKKKTQVRTTSLNSTDFPHQCRV